MDQEVHRLNRYAEELLADRRPTRKVLFNEHAFHARQAAALLSGIRPGAGIPSRRFLTRLEAQIAHWIQDGTQRPMGTRLVHALGVHRLQPWFKDWPRL
jgi:hypothetical protein